MQEKKVCFELPHPIYKHIPMRRNFLESFEMCQVFGGKKKEPIKEFEDIEWNLDECGDAFWMPIMEISNGNWVVYGTKNQSVPYLEFEGSDPNGNDIQVSLFYSIQIECEERVIVS